MDIRVYSSETVPAPPDVVVITTAPREGTYYAPENPPTRTAQKGIHKPHKRLESGIVYHGGW